MGISGETKNMLRVGGLAQVAEGLPGKCEAMSSNPNTTKK
jgi:hypothetical protein